MTPWLTRTPRPERLLDAEDRRDIRDLARQGLTAGDIARMTWVSPAMVAAVLGTMGGA